MPPTRTIEGLREVTAILDAIAKRDLDDARKDLRAASKAIAERHLIPALKRAAGSSGVPIAGRMADTARARADRIVFVKIGAVNPKLSGMRRGTGPKYRTGLAWGSERGPVANASENTYGVPNNPSGYWVAPVVKSSAIVSAAADEYRDTLDRIFRQYATGQRRG